MMLKKNWFRSHHWYASAPILLTPFWGLNMRFIKKFLNNLLKRWNCPSPDLSDPPQRIPRQPQHSQRKQRILVSSRMMISKQNAKIFTRLVDDLARLPFDNDDTDIVSLRYGLVASLMIPVHLLPLITLLPSIAFLLLSALLPESPVWLIRFD